VDVRENALAAAFRDPRFPPLALAEYESTSVEVSLLSPTEPFPVADEADLLARLRPGVDGVIIECGHCRATFLPQVWESLGEPRQFLAALKRKAGLPEGFWSREMKIARYRVTKWTENEFLASGAARNA
jgi:AmmeMemoRadiSam system protein A